MNEKYIIIGFGGHAHLLIEILLSQDRDILGATDVDKKIQLLNENPITFLGNDDVILDYSNKEIKLVNGVGDLPGQPKIRKELFEKFCSVGYTFSSIIHNSVIISKKVDLEKGVQILAGAVVQQGCFIGANTIINTNASIDHDSEIGNNCHIAPGATLCGNVTVGNNSFIGAGSTVINNISIGRNCLIAAGATIYKDIKDNTIYKNN